MVSKFLKLLNRDVTTMNQAALVLAVFSLLSQIFGLLRDRLLATLVGPSVHLDVYYAAFRIPDFIYNSFGILFSVTVLIPFITEYLHKKDSEETAFKRFSNSIFSFFMLGMLSIASVLLVIMPLLTRLTAPGFSGGAHAELTLFSRVMLLSPILMGLSSLLSSFAQVQKKFLSFAIAPVFYNLGILIGILVFRPWWGMLGVVLGVVLGAVFYFLVQLPPLLTLGKIPSFSWSIDFSIIKRILRLSVPRTLGSSLTNFTFLAVSALASLLAAGSISIFQFAYNIETTPLMIIGISFAVAAFPTLSRLYTERKHDEYIGLIYQAARNIFFLSVPVSLLIVVLRAHIVRLLLGAGNFSWNDTRLVAASLAAFSVSVVAQCLVLLMVRAFYARGDTKTPLKINLVAATITIGGAIGLLMLYHLSATFADFVTILLRINDLPGASVVMLPIAFSMGQFVNALLLWVTFRRHTRPPQAERSALRRTVFHTVGASLLSAAACYSTLAYLGSQVDQQHYAGVFMQGALAASIGVVTYVLILTGLKNKDMAQLLLTARTKFWKQKPMTPEQPDL